MSKLPPLPPADENKPSGTDEAKAGAKANAKETSESLSKASQSLKDLASGKANIVDTALAVKGAVDAVKGLSGKLSASVMMPVMKKLAAFKGKAILPAGKQMDPVLGIDVHMVTIPPSPAPVPMPHPYIGLLFDPKDWISCLVNTFKKQAMDAIPAPKEGATGVGASLAKNKEAIAGIAMGLAGLSASVKFGGFIPRAVAGTKTKNIPHIPMGAGFHPAFVATVAKNHGKAFLGSLFVAADGDPMVGSFHLNYDCWDVGIIDIFKGQRSGAKKKPEPGAPLAELYVPSGTVMPIPLGRPVLVNSIPTPINPMAILDKLFKAGLGKLKAAGRKAVQKGLDKLTGKVGCGALTRVSKLIGTGQSHPVDVAEGHFYTDNVDFSLPGPIPMAFERTWYSYSNYKGPLGYGWHHSYDMALAVDEADGMAALRMSDGRVAGFKLPLSPKGTFNRGEKLTLIEHEDGYYYVTDTKGLIYRFTQKIYRNPHNKTEVHLLQSIANRNGFAIRFTYNEEGLLSRITDSAGRRLDVFNDLEGHIIRIDAPHPDIKGQSFPIARYAYSPEGDLITQLDALDQPMQFEYRHHLMIREVWRNGLNWQFRYDRDKGIEAKCIEVWGDGDLLHYKFDYRNPLYTVVINSLGYKKIFYHKNGVVIKYIDPKGQAWTYRYNRFNEMEWEADPLGNATAYSHDEWGNVTSATDPAGGFLQMEFTDLHSPFLMTKKIDQGGGVWAWRYNEAGKVISKANPRGGLIKFIYEDGLLKSIVSPSGSVTGFKFSVDYNLNEIEMFNGGHIQYFYDRLGNCKQVINAKGAIQKRRHDLLGRMVNVHDFDGNEINMSYDGLDNLVEQKDKLKHASFTYGGIGKMTSRTQGGSSIFFKYDTENQLREVINQNGVKTIFEYDETGNAIKETGFDNVTRKYIRNAAGLVTKVERPNRKFTNYVFDACGRVVSTYYSDGLLEEFTYSKTGNLISAINPDSEVSFIRDSMGDIIKETIGDDWIISEYDVMGNRIQCSSSRGANISTRFDANGNMIEINANEWISNFRYDILGLEVERSLPGGVHSNWERDKIGRPSEFNLLFSNAFSDARLRKKYEWDVNNRLRQIQENAGIFKFEYNPVGCLTKTVFPDGEIQIRNQDRVGNLYNTEDRSDRIYTEGGRLQENGNWKYTWNGEGFLTEKRHAKHGTWNYIWNDAGRLVKVLRPDGQEVTFYYDALGRRVSKRFKNTITKFIWHGNVVLHEWKEYAGSKDQKVPNDDDPSLITWVNEFNSYTPIAKLKNGKKFSIVSDHLGTPTCLVSDEGGLTWQAHVDSFGNLQMEKGESGSCPFRFQGQYEDCETGLYYNRFRYYDPQIGIYISQDPVGLQGGYSPYGYVEDVNFYIDPLGLSKQSDSCEVGMKKAIADLKKNGYNIESLEVTMIVNGARIRADIVATDKNGKVHVFEVKNGTGRLTKNQKKSDVYDLDNQSNNGGKIRPTGNKDEVLEIDTDGDPGTPLGGKGATHEATFHTLQY